MKNGSICWDDTGELMVSSTGNKALLEHLSLGMFFLVVKFDMVKHHAEQLRLLIDADNFDASFSLGQTDIALLEAVHASTKILAPVPPTTTWDLLLPLMEKIKGAAWTQEDIACVYNFLKVVGDAHVDFLLQFAPFVDFDAVCLDPRDWDWAAMCLPPTMGWLKVCILCVQFMSDDEKAPRRGTKTLCSSVTEVDWRRL